MKCLKFTLSGKSAFFKNPDVNTIYYSYENIHKLALLGIFGSIIGLKGYNTNSFLNLDGKPEFYSELKDIKISILPKKDTFSKKKQTFNNSVGYANKDGNLIVEEIWLENVSWDIYVIIDNDVTQRLADNILNQKAVYIPYLGKNDHYANISDACLIDLLNVSNIKNISSIFMKKDIEIVSKGTKLYQEFLPFQLNDIGNYDLEEFAMTDSDLIIDKYDNIFKHDNLILYFF